jgi:hypothetical protein
MGQELRDAKYKELDWFNIVRKPISWNAAVNVEELLFKLMFENCIVNMHLG